jgi:hypothetical protein
VKYLEENAAASALHLSAADVARIVAIAPKGVALGARTPELAAG